MGPSLSLWLGSYGWLIRDWLTSRDLVVCRLELGGQRRELGFEAAAGVGPGQAADLHRGDLPARLERTGPSPDEDPPAADHERKQQPAKRGHAADQGGQLTGIVGDGQADPRHVAGERDRAPAA